MMYGQLDYPGFTRDKRYCQQAIKRIDKLLQSGNLTAEEQAHWTKSRREFEEYLSEIKG